MTAISLSGVTKRYGDVVAVRDLDLTVESGEIYGFLGPNGAGKSTTINMLLDFVRPTTGSVDVLSMDAQREPTAVRRRIGVLPEGYDVYDRLTGRQHLAFAIESKDVSADPDVLLDRVGLGDRLNHRPAELSGGQKQRVAIARALANEPRLVLADEPTGNLDRETGATILDEFRRVADERDVAVVAVTHDPQLESYTDQTVELVDGQVR